MPPDGHGEGAAAAAMPPDAHGKGAAAAAKQPSRVERVKQRFTNNPVGAGVVLLAAVLAAVGGAIGGVKAIAGLFDGDSAVHPITFSAGELDLAANARFGFSFRHPATWQRSDPENSDGSSFQAQERGVRLLAYGRNAVIGPPPSRERLDYLVGLERDNGKLVAGPVLQSVPEAQGGGATQGYRVVVRSPASAGTPALTSVVLLTTADDRDVTIRCEVPARRYGAYEGACTQLVGSLSLTR